MKVAIDTGPLKSGDKVRGVGFYTRELIDALKKISNKEGLLLYELDSETIKVKAHEYDVVHIPYFNPYFLTVPNGLPTKVVVTVHDVIPLLYPDKYVAGVKGKLKLRKQIVALKSIDAVITDTEASKKDIVRFLEVDKEKIHPTHLAASSRFKRVISKSTLAKVKKKYNLPDTFILYVGDVNYNKNIPTLIKATSKANVPLVIVGKQAANLKDVASDLTHLHGPRDWIRFLFGKPHPEVAHYKELNVLMKKNNVITAGFVSDKDLTVVYNLATIYCQPSLAEGFGLPVLEAFACGTPVVISKTQALVEVADDAALQANPRSIDEFAAHFKRLATSKKLRDEYSKKGTYRLKNYAWRKTAKETISIYQKVVGT